MLSLTTLGTSSVLAQAESVNADGTQVLKMNTSGKVNQKLSNPVTGEELTTSNNRTAKSLAKSASSSTPHPIWGYAMWTQETEFKSLSGRKPEPASNIQPGFGEP